MVYRSNMYLILGGLLFFYFLGIDGNELRGDVVPKVATMRFLVSVNDTWDPDGCIATVVTPTLIPDKKYNMSDSFQVGDCDHGPLTFTVQSSNGGDSKYFHMFLYWEVLIQVATILHVLHYLPTYVFMLITYIFTLRNS
ncbi:hypothetical protein ACJMK2_044123 [Sinanodonta woodiana]|uniref:Uncharacterized protein n=1 Tax=Sinanodonta woodiana TaxID=1069815 RepID=A0ABD3VZ09_SINWO